MDRSCAEWNCPDPDPEHHWHGPDPYCDELTCRLCCHDCDCDVCTGTVHAPGLHVLDDIPERERPRTAKGRKQRMTADLKDTLTHFTEGDYVTAKGVDTRGHDVTRVGTLLAPPKPVTAQRNGRRAKGWRLFVGLAGTSTSQRSTWVTLFPDAGSIESARPPQVGEWQNTPLGKIPGMRASTELNVRVLFGGKGGKRSAEPTQNTLARIVHNPDEHRYEVRDAETGETLLCPSWQTAIWWSVAPDEADSQTEEAETDESGTLTATGYAQAIRGRGPELDEGQEDDEPPTPKAPARRGVLTEGWLGDHSEAGWVVWNLQRTAILGWLNHDRTSFTPADQ
ncbi:hypothetical protein [Streptomyces sp. NPDC014733]|uniref:hypothetical protein n=1 Tax=Streptomyces sp. NPDC014733 TaxID=3364885 RepID=UPI0036F7BEC5